MIWLAFKFVKNIVKWTIRIVILAVVVGVLWLGFRFLVNNVTAQAKTQCQKIIGQVPGGKVMIYQALAEWLKTQSTGLISVTSSYYEKGKNGDQIVIEYSTLNNWYKGKYILDQDKLNNYCAK